MKKTLIILSSIVYLNGFTQLKVNLDSDGNVLQNNTHQQNKLNNQQAALTTFSYSNVRALTEINDPLNADAYPWISPDGLRLYYTSGVNNNQLMFTQRPNTTGNFVTPTVIPISTASLSSCWLSNNELDAYVCTVSSLYFTHRNTVSSTFNTPVIINLTGAPSYSSIKGASLNNSQDALFVTLFATSNIIAEFTRTSSTSFAYVRTLSLPPGYEPRIGQLSKDELTFFFGAKNNNLDPLLSQLTRTSTTLPFDVSTFQQIQGINDNNFSNNQPSMSSNLDWVAFVRNDTNLWAANDIFLAQRIVATSTCSPSQPNTIIGNNSISSGTNQQYSVTIDPMATAYLWTLPSGWSGNSSTNIISVTTGSVGGTISVVAQNSCGASVARNLSVSISNTGTITPGINYDWVWAKSTGDQNAGVYLKDMTTDNLGDTYITGLFSSSTIKFGSITLNKVSTTTNLFIAKYDANGVALWAKNACVGTTLNDCAIITDESNNVYISGGFKSAITFDGVTLTNPTGNTGQAMYFVKYNSNGNLMWAQDVNYSNDITVTGMSTDLQNHVFICGDYSAADINFGGTILPYYANNNPFIVKYDSLGALLWAKGTSQNNFGGIANFCYDVTTDLNGNSYITGNYMGNVNATLTFGAITLPLTNGGRDMYITKYNSLGDVEWVETSTGNSPNNGGREDVGISIVADFNGDIIVTGSFESANINFGNMSLTNYTTNNFKDIFVAKYNSLGNVLWVKKAGGSNEEEGTSVAVDNNNTIYVSGYFNSKPVTYGSFVINQIGSSPLNFIAKYDNLGNEVFVKHIEKTYSYSSAYPACVSCDANGNVFLSGKAYNDAAFGSTTLINGGVFIAKLGETQVGIREEDNNKESLVIYPNPNTGIFKIKNSEQLKNTNIKLYNTSGQLIFQSTGFVSEINISNQPKGIYLIQITSEGKISNKTVIFQ